MADTKDAAFQKYSHCGAYHWREISRSLLGHHAFTAERYRRTLAAASIVRGHRVLDYGCGDAALLSWISRCVGNDGEAHGFDPNPLAIEFATAMLRRRRLRALLHQNMGTVPPAFFDRVICAEVIEHVYDVSSLLKSIGDALRPGGFAVISTPVRLTERPTDDNHVLEWFPDEFLSLFDDGPLRRVGYEQFIPAAAPEVYYWRPRFLGRLPIFRLVCNALSIYGHVNALSWLGLRQRLFMQQLVVLEKP